MHYLVPMNKRVTRESLVYHKSKALEVVYAKLSAIQKKISGKQILPKQSPKINKVRHINSPGNHGFDYMPVVPANDFRFHINLPLAY